MQTRGLVGIKSEGEKLTDTDEAVVPMTVMIQEPVIQEATIQEAATQAAAMSGAWLCI